MFPVCAVTRSMGKKAQEEEDRAQTSIPLPHGQDSYHGDFEGLSDTFFTMFNAEDSKICSSTNMSEDVSLSRSQLIKEQMSDPELDKLRDKVLPHDEIEKVPVGYYLKEGVLMRKWRPPDIPASEDWSVIHQVVVPRVYRTEIIDIAHRLPLGGHLGVNKTFYKISKQFFWPGLRRDIADFCKTCHACQVVGKHQSDPPKAPLQPIPALDEPFSRVIIDCVGPLTKTKSGNMSASNSELKHQQEKHNDLAQLVVNMVAHFVCLLFTGFVVYTAQPGSSLFSWHPTLMVLAFAFLMAQAILVFSLESSLLRKASRVVKVNTHAVGMFLSLLCALIGTYIIWYNKEINEKPHMTSWHGLRLHNCWLCGCSMHRWYICEIQSSV